MNESNSQSAFAKKRRDLKKAWEEKSKLEQRLMIALIIVVVLFTGFLLFVIIKYSVFPKICHTSGCLIAASQIISHINTSVNPCDDFFKFACGKFITNMHEDIKASSIIKKREQVQRQLTEIIKEPVKDDDNYWIKYEKLLYWTCMNETGAEEESVRIFEQTLAEIDGWPVVVGYQWKERSFDWKNVIYKLRQDGYPHGMMLDVGVIEYRHDHIVRIVAPYLKTTKKEHKEAYIKYMTDVVEIFGAERNRAAVEMEKVSDFMENLRKIIEKSNLRNNTNEAVRHQVRFKVNEFQEINSEIDWLEFINTILHPVAKLSIDDYVLVPNVQFIEAFFTLIYRTTKRTLANFIIWMVLEEIMPHMSGQLKEREANYTCLTAGSPKEKDRSKYCQNTIKHSYRLQPSEIMFARKFLSQKRREQAQILIANVKSEFISNLAGTRWMDAESKERTLTKARNITDIIGAPGDYFNDAIFERFSEKGLIQKNDQNLSFFKMFLDQNKKLTDSYIFNLHLSVEDTRLDQFYSSITTVNAMYDYLENVIVYPVGILSDGIFYNPHRPMYLNYGALGSVIGHELTHGFELESNYVQDGRPTVLWTDETQAAYQKQIACIIQDAEEFFNGDEKHKLNGTLTLEENVADYTGFKVSYAAYLKWIDQNGEEPQLPEIHFTPRQLFWISAVSYQCFNDADLSRKDEYHAHNMFRATAPLRNNPNFSKDFNCPVGSKMNPGKECQIF